MKRAEYSTDMMEKIWIGFVVPIPILKEGDRNKGEKEESFSFMVAFTDINLPFLKQNP